MITLTLLSTGLPAHVADAASYAQAVTSTSVRVGSTIRVEGSGCPSPEPGHSVGIAFGLDGIVRQWFSLNGGGQSSYDPNSVWNLPYWSQQFANTPSLVGDHTLNVKCYWGDGNDRTYPSSLADISIRLTADAHELSGNPAPTPGSSFTMSSSSPCPSGVSWTGVHLVALGYDTETDTFGVSIFDGLVPLGAGGSWQAQIDVPSEHDGFYASAECTDGVWTGNRYTYAQWHWSAGGESQPPPPLKSLNTVSIGDSYSSGEGTYYYNDGRCHRGPHAWPRVLEENELGVVNVGHFACTGAETKDLDIYYKGTRQIQGPPEPSVELVTVTIGGNDVGFGDVLETCYKMPECMRSGMFRNFMRDADRLGRKLVSDTYPMIRRKYPSARIVHVGYPDIFPDENEWDNCAWLSGNEKRNLRRAYHYLNDTIRIAAFRSASDVGFLPSVGVFDDRELCTQYPLLVSIFGPTWALGSEQGHPNIEGQERWAEHIADQLYERGLIQR